MPKDYIPQNEAELITFAKNFQSKTAAAPDGFALSAAENTALSDAIDAFERDFDDNNATQTAARAARQLKDDSKVVLVAALRSQSQKAQTSDITDEQRADLGLTVKDDIKTSVGVPETRPVIEIDTSQPLRHTINFYDNESESRGKPDGVRGAEIYVKIGGEAAMEADDYKYLGTDTATPYLATHKAENVGQQAHYMLRWVNTKGEPGAWSNVETATITG